MPRIGLIRWTSCDEAALSLSYGPFFQGLVEYGHHPGKTILVDCRSAGSDDTGLGAAVAALVALPVDIIVAH